MLCVSVSFNAALSTGNGRCKVWQILKKLRGEALETTLRKLPSEFCQLQQHQCQGNGAEECVFAMNNRAGKADVDTRGGTCVFCASEA